MLKHAAIEWARSAQKTNFAVASVRATYPIDQLHWIQIRKYIDYLDQVRLRADRQENYGGRGGAPSLLDLLGSAGHGQHRQGPIEQPRK